MKIKVLIVEDDIINAWHVEQLLEMLESYEVIGIAKDAFLAKIEIESKLPDLLLMDIRLGEGSSGIELALEIASKNLPIVFMTQYAERDYFEQTSHLSNCTFLVKPFHAFTLGSAIRSVMPFSATVTDEHSFYIKTGNKREIVHPKTILWIESNRNYSTIQTEHRKYTVKRSLTKLYSELPSGMFVFIHKRFLVRLSHIKRINIKEQTIVVGNELFPLGRTYIKSLHEHLIQLG